MRREAAGAALVAVLVIAAIIGWQQHTIDGLRADAAEAARDAEADRLRSQGYVVAAVARAREAEASVAALRGQIAGLRRESPGARVVAAGHASTGPLIARHDEERPAPPASGTVAPDDAVSQPGERDDCLLRPGDEAELAADWARLDTAAGSRVLVGTAWARRLKPSPETIISGPIRADVSRFLVVPQPVPVTRSMWAVAAEYGTGGHWGASVERRVVWGAWAGLAAGGSGPSAYLAARVRIEW